MNEPSAPRDRTSRLVDARLAFALPLLVVVTCLWLVLELGAEVLSRDVQGFAFLEPPVSYWIFYALMVVSAIAIVARALKGRTPGVVYGASIGGALCGVAAIVILGWILRAAEGPSGSYVIFIAPVLALVLAVLALVVSLRSEAHKGRLVLAWIVAVAAPFALGPVVGWLSNLAGNAGMDAFALLVLPFVALAVWWAAVLLAAGLGRGGAAGVRGRIGS